MKYFEVNKIITGYFVISKQNSKLLHKFQLKKL